MGLLDFVFKAQKEASNAQIPEIFPLSLTKEVFIRSDILQTYTKILTDVIERTHGIPQDREPLLWDNCLQSEANKGVITLLAESMTDKKDLFLVYSPSAKVVRQATLEEETRIRKDYKERGESKVGVYISFRNYKRTQMLEIYSAFEYCVLSSLNKTLNISKAVQIKINDLRSSVNVQDAGIAIEQARSIARALGDGDDVMLDKNDEITSANPDTTSTEKAIVFLDAKRAFILGLPLAYVTGEQTGGIGSSGENDMRAIERGLKQYFVSIIRPVLKALLGIDTKFKSQDFRQMATALQVLKDFDLTSDEYLSVESKKEIVASIFDVDASEEQRRLKAEEGDREAEREREEAARRAAEAALSSQGEND